MTNINAKSYQVKIYTAGDIETAKRECRQFCFEVGLCVTVEKCDFIYTGGEESGYCVGLINYPRFKSTPAAIYKTAKALAVRLMESGAQWSTLILAPDKTEWITRRKDK